MSVETEGAGGAASPSAEDVFRKYLSRRERGEAVDLEAVCREHPRLAGALRGLNSLHRRTHEAASDDTSLSELSAGVERIRPAVESSSPSDSLPGGEGDSELGRFELGPGDRVGSYRLRSILGRGGMGVVFLARQEEPLSRRVALKVIRLGMDSREVIARFRAESEILARMQHPGIAQVLDAGITERGRPYFVMEYVAGEPITRYCDRHGLSIPQRLRLFLRVCQAVQHAHQRGVIHRDLKSSNVLVTLSEGGEAAPKVIDFGLAKAMYQRLGDESFSTEQGRFLGTPDYMSPEQCEMSPLEVDTRTDVYSLGVLLYELLCGRLPFDGRNLREKGPVEIARIVGEEEPESPSSRLISRGERRARKERADGRPSGRDARLRARQIRGELDWITLRAMEKDRTCRYVSAADLAADLGRYLRQEPVRAGPPGLSYRLRKLVLRNRVASVAALMVAVLAGLTVLVVGWQSERQFRSRLAAFQAMATRAARERVAYEKKKREVSDLTTRLKQLRREGDEWAPPWEKAEELAIARKLRSAKEEVEEIYSQTALDLHRALETFPSDRADPTALRVELEELYWTRYREALGQGGVISSPAFLRHFIESYGAGTYARYVRGKGRFTLQTEPPGAEVHCFRYEEREGRLVPLPYHPDRAREQPGYHLARVPFLRVEKVWEKGSSPFARGDRLLSVGDEPVATRGDLALALRRLGPDESVEVSLRRGGQERVVRWIPFSTSRIDRLRRRLQEAGIDESRWPRLGILSPPFRYLHSWLQFGMTFEAYPLEVLEENRLGVTTPDAPLPIELPRGSYLLLLRREGYADTRFPVSVPLDRYSLETLAHERVRLLGEGEIPEGFVHIPAGIVATGGDRHAFQPFEGAEKKVGGFFMQRCEVTTAEWSRYINDPAVFAATDDEGRIPPRTRAVRDLLEEAGRSELIRIVPAVRVDKNLRLFGERDDKGRRWVTQWPADRPVVGISQLAGIEYADWLTRRDGRWRYRLPDGLEWERAARGVDRRAFVWGDLLVWSHSWSLWGNFLRADPTIGVSPFDESIFGVRDLNGSAWEPTRDNPLEKTRFIAYRGGSWYQADEEYFRLASREGALPWDRSSYTGLRLIADLPAP